MMAISIARSGIAALAFAAIALPAAAAFPERPITLIVPFAAGGPGDTVVRLVGGHMARTLGQPIVVENAAGAGGTSAINRAAQASADGYTIVLGNMGTHGAAPAQYPDLQYDPAKDFAPIGLMVNTPIVIVARANFPANNLREFVDHVRKNQDKIVEAHAGVGSVSHTTCTLLQSIIGTKTARVAYRGTGPSMNDLIAGHVDFGCDQIVNVAPHIQAGTLKAFGVATAERSAVIKDVPTTSESGLPEFEVSAWIALFAPKSTPKHVVGKLNDALVKALDDEGIRARLLNLGSEIPDRAARTPDALQALVVREVARWTPVLKSAAQ
ncbi:tripartite tricarboxylate transporter family receptor [Variibacter gotjawalensis]|uniref:Tripartite tricarboxylate transporter family receptor n=1 Tax=Variibacter gotjawalensis TaxID=1333996 RepID=A0A0S3PVX8_9BRAD|nr:tripartite tricarboxylate transporter substrate-binding protein [Variibacter gotjawalensis]NIK45915.1 tripartite-type tricarboxylate transporter receptor subunit TctC [Variibacter gotjawalensis]RZS47835.1 tripartite-type tricarboxylate transporter receptor subunit TctC [Variibacter gotjawalensis]BAT60089.1 tripartite tricarboxylate transporter family receptor [Variibacter gotjawalensis]